MSLYPELLRNLLSQLLISQDMNTLLSYNSFPSMEMNFLLKLIFAKDLYFFLFPAVLELSS